MTPGPGRVAWLGCCVGRRAPMHVVETVTAITDRGFEGDRHAREGSGRQVLLVDGAVVRAEGLVPGDLRENVTVENLAVDRLPPGSHVRLGAAVVLRVTGPCEPCGYIDTLRPGLQAALVDRRGTLCTVVAGGPVRLGDEVTVLPADG